MIVPVSIVSTDGFSSLRKLLKDSMRTLWYSSFSMRPGKLFDGVEKHLTIFVSRRTIGYQICSSKYHRWLTEERAMLFSQLQYTVIDEATYHNDSIPKIGRVIESSILRKLKADKAISSFSKTVTKHVVYHTRKLRYFLQFLDTPPKNFEEDGSPRITSELKHIPFDSEEHKFSALSAYLSSLFFWFYITYSDCRNLNKREVMTFPFTISDLTDDQARELVEKGRELMTKLQKNSYYQEAYYKEYGNLKMQVFQPRITKSVIDDIDEILSNHYGFTEEELDFIINYDIKYRLGKELQEEE